MSAILTRTVPLEVNLADDLTYGFAARYIRHKARQLIGKAGFVASDQPDIEQDLKLALWLRLPKFVPARAAWTGFVVAVINRKIASILKARRSAKRYCCVVSLSQEGGWVESAHEIEERHLSAITGRTVHDDFAEVDQRCDVATVMASLPGESRHLCDWMLNESVAAAAKHLRVCRETIHVRLRALRKTFVRAGFFSDTQARKSVGTR